jgi:hypothetical protein
MKLLAPLLLMLTSTIYTYADDKRSYETKKIQSSPPNIDGVLNEPVWNEVDWSGDFKQIEPYENIAPSEQTAFKILYDNNNLYIAIRAFDSSPDSIVKRMSRRDEFEGDWVEVNIDSYHDLRTAFSFTINAAGVKGDEAITNGNNWDTSWDPIWYGKTSIDKEGWIAEIQIPLTQLRFAKKENYIWGLQVSRRIFRHEEHSSWQFISPNASGYVHNFGEIHGISNIIPRKQKDLTPYTVAKYGVYQPDYDNPFADGKDFSPSIGLDGKIGITNDLTLDFTINPDFGQVEADPSEVNLTTFETFFPEKRTFFIEGKNILNHRILGGGSPLSRDNLFYSRRIGKHPTFAPDVDNDENEYAKVPDNTTILGAFKVTGKTTKGLSIGILESITQKEIAQVDRKGVRSTEIAEPFTNYFAARAEQDFNNSNTRIGAMVTSTNRNLTVSALDSTMVRNAYTGGINFNHQWKDKTYYIDGNIVFSQVNGDSRAIHELQTSSPHFFQRPDANYVNVDSTRNSIEGFGGTVQAGKSGNSKLRYLLWLTWRSPGLNLNDIGYIKRTDEIMEVFWVGYYQNEPFSIFRNANININQWYGWTWGLEHKYMGANINGHVRYKNNWCTGLGISRDGKSISTHALRGGPSIIYEGYTNYNGHIGTDNRRKVRFVFAYSGGQMDEQYSFTHRYNLNINLRLSDAFKMTLSPSYSTNNDKIAFVSTVDDVEPNRYIRGHLRQKTTSLTFRFTYNISPDFTIQYYAMPFISAGNYTDFKYVANAKAENFNDRYVHYTSEQMPSSLNADSDDTYYIDENLDGTSDYDFSDPNFNVRDFNSNLVLRWEYRPGSILYIVWTQNRNKSESNGHYSFLDDTNDLFMETYPYDVFLVKLSYRLGL